MRNIYSYQQRYLVDYIRHHVVTLTDCLTISLRVLILTCAGYLCCVMSAIFWIYYFYADYHDVFIFEYRPLCALLFALTVVIQCVY